VIDRRTLIAGLSGALIAPCSASAQTVKDAAGRSVPVPAKVSRVFPAGPPAAILLYTLAPDLLIGWPRANRPEECAYMLPEICTRPEVGRITGRGNTANLETVLALKPDLILDFGSTTATFVSLADRVQEQTSIPYALLDGRFAGIAGAYRTLGALIGRADDAEKLARTKRAAKGLLCARAEGACDRARRLDQCRDHRIDQPQCRGRNPGRSRQCFD
jgi:iron complex transport system substrate-binding protein